MPFPASYFGGNPPIHRKRIIMATSVQENPEAVARIPELIVGDRNARGIPSAIFVVRRALFPCNYHWQAHPFGSPRRLAL